jgi:hypothetical protein
MSSLDLDALTRKFMNELVSSLKDATYTFEKYRISTLGHYSRISNPVKGISQEKYEMVIDKCYYTICSSITTQFLITVNNIKFNPTCLLIIQKYFHFLPDYENDGFPLTESTYNPINNNIYSNFQSVENKISNTPMLEIIRNVFNTGEHYINSSSSELNKIIAIDGLYSAYYKFLKALLISNPPPRFQPPSPLDPPPSSPKTYTKKIRNTKQVRDTSLTKKYRNQRASKFPDWWTKTEE